MRVQGEKQRVVLRAEDMEPSEAKPSLRIAPIAALCIWLCSTLIATAIYLEWVPVRALFEREPSADEWPEQGAALGARAAKATEERRSEPVGARPPHTPITSDTRRKAVESPRFTKTESKPEPARVIRGSYHSEAHWAAGW